MDREHPGADARARSEAEAVLRDRLAFEELVLKLSTQLVAVPTSSVDDAVHEALGTLGVFAHVDRAYVFRFSSDRKRMQNTHEWCAPGVEPVMHLVQNLALEDFAWWAKEIRERRVIHLADVARDLPPEAVVERESLAEQGVLSVLAVPTILGGDVVGFLGFDAVREKKRWPDADVTLVRIASELVLSALERKRAEQERRALEAQLVQAKSMENVARLAGGVAHDFNNLLAIILNYATILRRSVADDVQREQVGELFDAARRAAGITRQLLVTGRRDVVEPVLLDVDEVVDSLKPLLERVVGEAHTLELSLARNLRATKIGLPQLEQVVLNLTANARDAMPSGGTLRIETAEVDVDEAFAARFHDFPPGPYVRLRVADGGVGMAPEVADRAFDPFFTTKGANGTGLGLSTVQAIVERATGRVVLTSAPGAGTTADVFLRVEGGEATELAAPDSTTAPRGRGEVVLVVEDSPALRKLVCAMLEANGYVALEAPDGPTALALLAERGGEVDALLTDVVLPQMSGREVAEAATARFGVERVLFVSGYDDDVIVRHGYLEPGVQLLPKPFLEGDLARAIRRVLDGEPGALHRASGLREDERSDREAPQLTLRVDQGSGAGCSDGASRGRRGVPRVPRLGGVRALVLGPLPGARLAGAGVAARPRADRAGRASASAPRASGDGGTHCLPANARPRLTASGDPGSRHGEDLGGPQVGHRALVGLHAVDGDDDVPVLEERLAQPSLVRRDRRVAQGDLLTGRACPLRVHHAHLHDASHEYLPATMGLNVSGHVRPKTATSVCVSDEPRQGEKKTGDQGLTLVTSGAL
jgi:signal transduction histidine kinase/CheY-like chemotaxis protein